MSRTINLHVGSIEDMGKRFIGAWHKLEKGKAVDESRLAGDVFDIEFAQRNFF